MDLRLVRELHVTFSIQRAPPPELSVNVVTCRRYPGGFDLQGFGARR